MAASVHSSHHSSRVGATMRAFTTSAAAPISITTSQPSPQITSTYPPHMSTSAAPLMMTPTGSTQQGVTTFQGSFAGNKISGSIAGSLQATGSMQTSYQTTQSVAPAISTTYKHQGQQHVSSSAVHTDASSSAAVYQPSGGAYVTTSSNMSGGDMTPQALIQQLPNAEFLVKGELDQAYFGETRKVSSVVLESQPLSTIPSQESVRYVDVPVVEEQVRYVTRKEVLEVEKIVPKIVYDTVEKIVEKPVITYVDKTIEVPVETIIEHPQIQVVEVTKEIEVPEYVPKVVYKEKIVEVPGQVIEVPRPYPVERQVVRAQAVDKHVPVVVAQTIKPLITESERSIIVDVLDYEPEVVPVDVHVAKPVNSALELVGQLETRHKLVNVTSSQYNSILRSLNAHMDEEMRATLPFIPENGRVSFVADANAQYIVAPPNISIEGWVAPVQPQSVMVVDQVTTLEQPKIVTREAVLSSGQGTMSMESQIAHPDLSNRRVACCGVADWSGNNTAQMTNKGALESGVLSQGQVMSTTGLAATEHSTRQTANFIQAATQSFGESTMSERPNYIMHENKPVGTESGLVATASQLIGTMGGNAMSNATMTNNMTNNMGNTMMSNAMGSTMGNTMMSNNMGNTMMSNTMMSNNLGNNMGNAMGINVMSTNVMGVNTREVSTAGMQGVQIMPPQGPMTVQSRGASTRRSKSSQETHKQQRGVAPPTMGSAYGNTLTHSVQPEGGSIRSHVVSTAAPRSRVCC